MHNENDEFMHEDHWQDKCDSDYVYKVTITITSDGCSQSAKIHSRFSRGTRGGEIEMMSDTGVGVMDKIDSLPFASLLQIEHALELAEVLRENGMPSYNYSPGVMPAAEIIGASLLGHIRNVIDNSPD